MILIYKTIYYITSTKLCTVKVSLTKNSSTQLYFVMEHETRPIRRKCTYLRALYKGMENIGKESALNVASQRIAADLFLVTWKNLDPK
jgi:hypothetical protein